jgi:hypothetical protein
VKEKRIKKRIGHLELVAIIGATRLGAGLLFSKKQEKKSKENEEGTI